MQENEELTMEDLENPAPLYDRSKKYRNLPHVVIVGRPNVGKSTLFNRMLHKRRAITDPTPGVTRDPISETAFINDMPVRVTDTGGFKLERDIGTMEAVLDELVVQKSIEALKTADVILLLLEAGTVTGEDEEFINLLRPYWPKLIAAVNKTEGGRNEEDAYNFYQYGFEELMFISAEHGDHIPELYETLIKRLDFTKVEKGEEEGGNVILKKDNAANGEIIAKIDIPGGKKDIELSSEITKDFDVSQIYLVLSGNIELLQWQLGK